MEKTISNNRDKHVQILSDKMNDFSQELFGIIQKNQISILELKNKNNLNRHSRVLDSSEEGSSELEGGSEKKNFFNLMHK